VNGEIDPAGDRGFFILFSEQSVLTQPALQALVAAAPVYAVFDITALSDGSIKHFPVQSSAIESIGYGVGTRTLEILFKGRGEKPGGLYQYPDVPASVYLALMASDSKGQFLAKYITGVYTPTRIR
jgi:hypothetical protein